MIKDFLKNIGLLDEVKITKGLEEQSNTKEKLSKVLLKFGYLANENIGKNLAAQAGILPAGLAGYEIDDKLIKGIPNYIALAHRIIPLKIESGRLFIGTDDILNYLSKEFFEKTLGISVEIELVQPLDVDNILEKNYSSKTSQIDNIPSQMNQVIGDIKDVKNEDDTPIIKLVNMIIGDAVKKRASDIHVEPLENKFRIRYRIDGILQEMQAPPKRLQGSIISRLKIMAGMDIAEKRLPQDGRIKTTVDKKELDLRVSTLPAIHGESVVMRILDKTGFLVGIEELGFLSDNKRDFQKLMSLPNGMILVTGPTGSGKTTTLYSALMSINQRERKVITIEDPVEYQLDGINQVQVKPQINLTFAAGLRSMLRQAPDIIMVGEIRDLETAEISIQSALTGHLIFSTLHTNDAPSAVTRLVDMGIKSYLVASTVQGVLAQRLVRTICPVCRESYVPSEEEKILLGTDTVKDGRLEFYKGKGCPSCNNTGYKGRIGIFELLIMNDAIRELVIQNNSSSEISKKARECGMRTLKEDGIEKIKRGYTTIEEVLRVTQDI